MRFIYTYRSSDGQRHTAEIEAENRDTAFARVRSEMGVKPIKVVAADTGSSSKAKAKENKPKTFALFAVLAVAAAGGVFWWWFARRNAAPYQVMTHQGPVTYSVAVPLPRQSIPGDRRRIDVARDGKGGGGVFRYNAEAWLARYAEPGRAAGGESIRPSESDFGAALREPIRIASTDFTEVVDLKRIVEGIKREMRAYVAGGGTLDGYLAELDKRQRLEISYRENAEGRLGRILGEVASKPHPDAKLKGAYDYWLKANASLKAMGIYEIPLPDALRGYQQRLGLDEYE